MNGVRESQRFETVGIVPDSREEPLGVGVGVEVYSWSLNYCHLIHLHPGSPPAHLTCLHLSPEPLLLPQSDPAHRVGTD